jgi:hypothetical protein
MQFFNSDEADSYFVKILNYGETDAGKTFLFSTVPDVSTAWLISAEAGTLSLRGQGVSGCVVNSMADIQEAYSWLTESDEARGIDFVGLDSISEVGDICLAEEMESTKDGRQAYGNMGKRMRRLIRSFRDLPGKHIYMSARQARLQDDGSRMFYGPDMPGSKMGPGMAYWFDEVFCQRVYKIEEDGEIVTKRALQTSGDGQYIGKDRSGKLAAFEEPNLNGIIEKILN